MKFTDVEFIKEKLDDIKVTLQQNLYSLLFIERFIKERIHSIYNRTSKNNKQKNSQKNTRRPDIMVTLPDVQGIIERKK